MKLSAALRPMKHCEDATAYLLRALGVKFTKLHLQKELVEHPDKKDYDAFGAKYPMTGGLSTQKEELKKMRKWCDTVRITATPTFFVCTDTRLKENSAPVFYLLPEMYTVADLKYFFTV